ncbi:hypothetical protein [Mammaliicoccus sciuri]|uniref:hypothetical protein n=1 Tax=Mammaliicoccus sciuri TaxID=1296 RepID=UPI0034DD758D
MKKVKTLLIPFLIIGFIVSCNSTVSANEDSTDIAYEIGEKYEIGQTLNAEDEKIIKNLMAEDDVYIKGEAPKVRPYKLVSGTKKFNTKNGSLKLTGSCNYNFWKSPKSNYYNCKVTASKKGNKSTKATLRHIGYGAGTKGIIKSYDRTFSNSAKKSSVSVSHKESYSGLTAWGVFKGTAKSGGKSVTQTLQ